MSHDKDQQPFDDVRAFGEIASLARDALPPPEDARASAAAFARFQRVADGPRAGARAGAAAVARRRARLAWGVSAGALALAAVVVLAVVRRPVAVALSVRVERGAIAEGGYLRATTAAGQPSLHFSDGTEVEITAASRVRVAETDDRGARVLLEDGHARARVVPRHGSRWTFDAGPCRVRVTGTRFDMHWSAARQILEVSLYSGSVTVEGPPAVAGVPMRSGQRLIMDVRHGSVRFGNLGDGASLSDSDQPAPERPPELAPVSPPAQGATGRSVAPLDTREAEARQPDRGWPAQVLAGNFHDVIREAKRRGVDQVLRRESASNLMALADAARYAGAARLAARTLTQVRGRFPQSPAAHRSAFLLGRLAEDQGGDLDQALDWYRVYLADASDGPRADSDGDTFRAEALGRQMTVTLRVRGVAVARPMAAEYLRRYPRGAYARAARVIVAP